MSVKENVMAATYGRTQASLAESILRLPRARREERESSELAEEKLSFFGQRLMGYRWNQPAYSLSYANRRQARDRARDRDERRASSSSTSPPRG